MKLDKFLNQVGFKTNEVAIYLAALETGLTSPPELANKTGLPRTTINLILKHLVERGFIGKTLIKKRVHYLAEPPDKILGHLKELLKYGEEILPELEARYNQSEHKPRIVFYEGVNAVQKVYDDTLATKPTEILEWNTDAYFAGKQHVDRHYIAKRMKLGIKAKRIAGSGSKWDTHHRHYDSSELAETIIVPRDLFWPEIEVNIYGNKVAFLNYAENISVIIESKAIASAMRQAYHLSWIGAKQSTTKN